MGSRNRAFYEDDEPSPTSRNSRDEIPSISKHTHTDGAQFTKYVRISVNQLKLIRLSNDFAGREDIRPESERLCDEKNNRPRDA